jgi:hypothetical protein
MEAKKTKHTVETYPQPPKHCRHRVRMSSGRCRDCGWHREPAVAVGGGVLPSAALAVHI